MYTIWIAFFISIIIFPGTRISVVTGLNGEIRGQIDGLQVGEPTTDADWNSDNSILAVSRIFSGIYLYNSSFQEIGFIPISTSGGISKIAWSPINPKVIAVVSTGTPNTRIEVWNIDDTKMLFSTALPLSDFHSISWSPDGIKLAIVGGFIGEVWDITTRAKSFEFDRTGTLADDSLYVVDWNSAEDLIATDGVGEETVFWNANTGNKVATIPSGGFIAWSPNGSYIAIVNETIQIFDTDLNQVISPILINGRPSLVKWQGNTLAISSFNDSQMGRVITLINTNTFEVIDTIELDYTPVIIALTSGGEVLTLVDSAGNFEVQPITSNCNFSPTEII